MAQAADAQRLCARRSLLADFLSLYAEAVKEGGLEANVSLNGAEMA